MQRLPGIINIYYVLASSLMASITQKALADAPVGVFADTFLVPHIGDAICEMETQFDNNDTLEKVKLSFSTTSQLQLMSILLSSSRQWMESSISSARLTNLILSSRWTTPLARWMVIRLLRNTPYLIQTKWHLCHARRDERLFSCLFVTFCMQLKHCAKT